MSKNRITFNVTQFKSAHLLKVGDELNKPPAIITKEEFKKIEHFKKYTDSLAGSPAGKEIYDSILISRPGLIDSIILLENIYHSQIKN